MSRPNRRVKPNAGSDGCQMCSHDQILGEIQGTLKAVVKAQENHGAKLDKAQENLEAKLDKMDDRLRSVENKGAIAGAVAGIMVALGIDLAKQILTRKA